MTENDTLPPPTAPLPPGPMPPTRPPLRRSREQNMVGGICGGIAQHTGIDVLLFRVGFVVLVFAGGAGLLLYAALWLLLPDADGRPGPLLRWIDERPTSLVRTVALGIAVVALLAVIVGAAGADGGLLAVAALAALGWLWTRDRNSRQHVSATAVASADPSAEHLTATYPTTALPTLDPDPPVAGRPRRPRRPRSRLGAVTISVLLVVLGALAIADRNTNLSVSTAGYLGAALGVVGAGLLVGTFWGRSRGLIFLGIPLLAVLIPVSALDVDLQDGIGKRLWTVGSPDELRDGYRLGAGYGRLDLTEVDFTDGAATTVTVNVGYAEILLPPEVDVTIRSEVTAGQITLFDVRYDGSDVRRTLSDDGADGPGGGDLELVVNVNLGALEVTRVR